MAHRKVNVDAIVAQDDDVDDDNVFPLSSTVQVDINTILQELSSRGSEVLQLIQRGNNADAVKRSLENPPYSTTNVNKALQDAKDKSTKIVVDALSSTKSNEIPMLLQQLSVDQYTVLMKYLYRGMTSPDQFNPTILLTWHEKLTEIAGVGCIVRVLADRRVL